VVRGIPDASKTTGSQFALQTRQVYSAVYSEFLWRINRHPSKSPGNGSGRSG
jgi:hypothetical protein